MGFGETMSNLFQNDLFRQYLAAAGQDLVSGNPIGTNVNAVTNQNIAAKNKMKMLQELLGGSPENKLTIDGAGKYKLEGLGDFTNPVAPGNVPKSSAPADLAMAPTPTPAAPTQPTLSSMGGSRPNPFDLGSLNFSGSDLAGLTPEMIDNVFQTAIGIKKAQVDFLAGEEAATVDSAYKAALTEESRARAAQLREPKEIDRLSKPAPVQLDPDNPISQGAWDSLPTEEKEYQIYVVEARANNVPEDQILSRRDYSMMDPTQQEKLLRAFQRDPALLKIEKDLAKAKAPTTNVHLSPGQQDVDAGKVAGRVYIISNVWTKDLDKDMSDFSYKLAENSVGEQNKNAFRAAYIGNWIESTIIKKGGEIIKNKDGTTARYAKDNKTLIWRVKFPGSNEIDEVQYAVGQP